MKSGSNLTKVFLDLAKRRSVWLTALMIAAGSLALGLKYYASKNNCLNRPQIGSYYYPWYTINRWKSDQSVLGKPYLGFYDNSEAKVINQHLRWASQAGIDYLIYSWLGTDTKQHKMELERSQSFINQVKNSDIKIMPLYETPLALNQSPEIIDLEENLSPTEKVGDRFIKDMLYFANQGEELDSFLKYNGCPRISIYLARNLVNAETYFERLRRDLKNQGKCLDLTADVAFWNSSNKPLVHSILSSKEQWNWLAKHFSAILGYNMYSHDLNVYGVDKNMSFDNLYIRAKRKNHKEWKKYSKFSGLKYQYSVQPGYDDRSLRGMGRPAIPPSSDFLHRDWDRIFDNLRYGDHVLITSFNEWYEGTAVEPSKQHGEELILENQKMAARIKNKFCRQNTFD